MNMASKQERLTEKGIVLAAAVDDVLLEEKYTHLRGRVTTEGGRLTKLLIWSIVGEPDAAGQGGQAPLG